MKIAIVTNLDPACGNAEDARDLEKYIGALGVKIWRTPSVTGTADADVVIVNWHPAVVPFTAAGVRDLQARGKKVILLLQNSFDTPFIVEENDILKAANVVVAHEPMMGNVNIVCIPVGVAVVESLRMPLQKMIGVAGFSFPWKRFDVAAQAAKENGAVLRMIAPPHATADTQTVVDQVRQILPPEQLEIIRAFLPVDDVVRLLSECTLTMFWFQSRDFEDTLGQTGSARMGVAAQRPMVISRHRKFKTMVSYEDDLYVADTEEQAKVIASMILQDPDRARKPVRLFMEQNWREAARKYVQIAREIMG